MTRTSSDTYSLISSRGRKYMSAAERKRFLAAARAAAPPRRRAFALALAYTGARISEILALRGADVDADLGVVRIRSLKRRAEHWREAPAPDSLLADLAGFAMDADPLQRLFPISRSTGYRIVRALMRQAEIRGPQATPRGLRHGFAIAAVSAGVPLATVAALMGHADVATTSIYAAAVGPDARALVARMWRDDV